MRVRRGRREREACGRLPQTSSVRCRPSAYQSVTLCSIAILSTQMASLGGPSDRTRGAHDTCIVAERGIPPCRRRFSSRSEACRTRTRSPLMSNCARRRSSSYSTTSFLAASCSSYPATTIAMATVTTRPFTSAFRGMSSSSVMTRPIITRMHMLPSIEFSTRPSGNFRNGPDAGVGVVLPTLPLAVPRPIGRLDAEP